MKIHCVVLGVLGILTNYDNKCTEVNNGGLDPRTVAFGVFAEK
jgi:hypothetical protein